MKMIIEIPKEFEEHFRKDKFEDSLNRLLADAHCIADRYEKELANMLITAFKESEPVVDLDMYKDLNKNKITLLADTSDKIYFKLKDWRKTIK